VLENFGNVLASIVEDQIGAAGVRVEKVGDIVDFVTDNDVAVCLRVMRFDLSTGEGRENSGRHSARTLGVKVAVGSETEGSDAEWVKRDERKYKGETTLS